MAAFLEIAGLSVSYGSTAVLQGIDLAVEQGEMVALLGASGCGKTTLLRALAGFIEPDRGSIAVGGRAITALPPEQRGMAMMFQSYALWPHMTVRQNVAYGLKLRRRSREEIHRRVDQVLSLLGLSDFAERSVTQLSGGQRQRVALGRALAIEPSILLLDEPLSNLDAKIRQQVRHDLKSIQQRLGITALIVTHDREEAMIMADRVVVLNAGRVAQIGTPEDLYARPADAYVADFMGADNQIALIAEPQGGGVAIRHPDSSAAALLSTPLRPGPVKAYFRAQAAQLRPLDGASSQGLLLPGVIRQRTYPGGGFRYVVEVGDGRFLVDGGEELAVGQPIGVFLPEAALHLFPVDSPTVRH